MKKLCIILIVLLIIAFSIIRCTDFTEVIAVDIDEAKQTLIELQICKDSNLSNERVTRLNFAISLLKCIGATEATNEYYIESEPYAHPYNDLDECPEKCGYIFALDEVMTAHDYSTRKPYEIINSDNDKPFEAEKNISVKDAVTFILSCTRDSGDSYWDGIRLGVISKKDACFSLFGNKSLTYDDMCVLLYRVLMQSRYQYLDYRYMPNGNLATPPWWAVYLDKEHSMTYMEYLNSKRHD